MRHNVLNAGSQKMPGNQTKHAHMSGNGAPLQKMDRRVRRTRNALGDALVALMHEKPFAAIRIQDVLYRAQISRSTFYTHYSDKDDLFLSDAEDFFEIMAFHLSRRDGERSNRVAPMREMFVHVAEVRRFYATMVASGKLHHIWELGQGCFARGIEQRLEKLKPDLSPRERTILANAFAGAFMSLMSWWIHHGMSCTPEQMDALYHRMVWFGLGDSNR